MAATDADVIRGALAELRAEDPDADEGALLAQLVRAARQGAPASAETTQAAPVKLPEARYRIVIEECPSCRHQTHNPRRSCGANGSRPLLRARGFTGRREVDAAVAAEARCDHEKVDLTDPEHHGHLTRSIRDTVKREVLHRDGYRCAVPGCGSHLWTDIHHLKPFAEGGGHGVDNLATVCGRHHRALHRGLVVLTRAPNGTLDYRRRSMLLPGRELTSTRPPGQHRPAGL